MLSRYRTAARLCEGEWTSETTSEARRRSEGENVRLALPWVCEYEGYPLNKLARWCSARAVGAADVHSLRRLEADKPLQLRADCLGGGEK